MFFVCVSLFVSAWCWVVFRIVARRAGYYSLRWIRLIYFNIMHLFMKTGIQVADAMTVKPVTVGPNATLLGCAELMAREHVGSLLVVENGKVLGIFTEQDMVRKGMVLDKPASSIRAREIMESKMVMIEPRADIMEAAEVLRERNIRHLPVVHNGKLAGLVTGKDILKLQPDLFDIFAQRIELRESDRKMPRCDSCGERCDDDDDDTCNHRD